MEWVFKECSNCPSGCSQEITEILHLLNLLSHKSVRKTCPAGCLGEAKMSLCTHGDEAELGLWRRKNRREEEWSRVFLVKLKSPGPKSGIFQVDLIPTQLRAGANVCVWH
jgi:hypothetical protein